MVNSVISLCVYIFYHCTEITVHVKEIEVFIGSGVLSQLNFSPAIQSNYHFGVLE